MNLYITLLKDAINELAAQKLRTFLTLLGMIFGVGAVIAMLNIGAGAEREALQMINSMGVNNLIIESNDGSAEQLREIREQSLGLSMGDVNAALQTLPFIQDYSASKGVKVHALYSDRGKSSAQVFGVTTSYFEHASLALAEGRYLTEDDNRRLAQVAVLGSDAATELFGQASAALGGLIKVNHLWLRVVGILDAPANTKDEFQGVKIGGDQYRVFIPIATTEHKLKRDTLASELDVVKLGVKEGFDPRAAAQAVDQLMRLRHGEVDDYQLIVPAALLEQQAQTQAIFNIVMACVAGISLLVGGIGIMNIMLANVLERTKEIGLLRAVGATQRDIRLQFLAESFTISALGGVLGVVFGLALSELIGFYSGWAVIWSILAIVLSLVICMLVGVGFGVFPAIKASKLNPIDALHSD
ncbi:ABC transporter permease [Alteromonas oceanisediminis]|uniref:ABC transporter permease n=1 Tax=Alteromonas oceanisediminis TaxID=2836180 RepID=UPI001BDA7B9A|nr:ABC transporter permease [Alteromonas oceanisediminis]MBT0586228.1 ABC transporter permease [Alteromonas oceanisediminis]